MARAPADSDWEAVEAKDFLLVTSRMAVVARAPAAMDWEAVEAKGFLVVAVPRSQARGVMVMVLRNLSWTAH